MARSWKETVALLPWLVVREPVQVGGVRFIPFDTTGTSLTGIPTDTVLFLRAALAG